MGNYTTNEFKSGLKIMIDNDPYVIVENEFVKPGKGQAFNRVRIRNLRSGRVLERTFKSGESVEGADVVDMELQYLYNDGELWHFMHPGTFEQMVANKTVMGEAAQWIKGEEMCQVTLWNGEPLLINAPNFVNLKIVETDPGVRGDTATGGAKPAKLESGAVVKVPLFVEQGEIIRVDTRSGQYMSRAKS